MRKFWKKMKQKLKQWASPQALFAAAKAAQYPREKMQESKRQTRFNYVDGPMNYIGQQIVKGMQDAGYPAKIMECYRPPERQDELYVLGRSRARAWQSPHQFYEAVDIVHPAKYWNVSSEYWETLASVVKIVADKFNVKLDHGHYWKFTDSAHIELKGWRNVRDAHKVQMDLEGSKRERTPDELWQRFVEVLPAVAKARS